MWRRDLVPLMLTVLAVLTVCPKGLGQPEQVLITLFGTHKKLDRVIIDGPLEVLQPVPRRLAFRSFRFVAAGGVVRAMAESDTAEGGNTVLSSPRLVLQGQGGLTTIRLDARHQRSYKGTISLTSVHGNLSVQNLVDARDYVKSVVGSEALPEFPVEALKVQSVLSQTLLSRYKLGDYLNDTTETQAYLGQDCVRPAVEQAVDDTWGQRLEFHGRPVRVYFHSTCAGGTSDGEIYFALTKNSAPYLHGIACNYCRRSPFWKTQTARVPLSQWVKSMGAGSPEVVATDNRGRPLRVVVDGRTVSGYDYWLKVGQRLGWDKVPGTRYRLISQPGATVLTSAGAGHGVGLCQWGACELARMGKSYGDILRIYFPGTVVQGLKKTSLRPISGRH